MPEITVKLKCYFDSRFITSKITPEQTERLYLKILYLISKLLAKVTFIIFFWSKMDELDSICRSRLDTWLILFKSTIKSKNEYTTDLAFKLITSVLYFLIYVTLLLVYESEFSFSLLLLLESSSHSRISFFSEEIMF